MVLTWQLLPLLTINLSGDVFTLKQSWLNFFTLVKPVPYGCSLQLSVCYFWPARLFFFVLSPHFQNSVLPCPITSLSFGIRKQLLIDITVKRKEYIMVFNIPQHRYYRIIFLFIANWGNRLSSLIQYSATGWIEDTVSMPMTKVSAMAGNSY